MHLVSLALISPSPTGLRRDSNEFPTTPRWEHLRTLRSLLRKILHPEEIVEKDKDGNSVVKLVPKQVSQKLLEKDAKHRSKSRRPGLASSPQIRGEHRDTELPFKFFVRWFAASPRIDQGVKIRMSPRKH